MIQFLEEMVKTYNASIPEFGEQQVDIRREAAKDRALECILHAKILSSKILSDIYTQVTGEAANNGFSSYRSVDANTFEEMVSENYFHELEKRDMRIASLQKQIKAQDVSI